MFRKKQHFKLSGVFPMFEKRLSSNGEQSSVLCSDVLVPSVEDYNLENLLQSGVPLSVIPTSDLLTNTDASVINQL